MLVTACFLGMYLLKPTKLAVGVVECNATKKIVVLKIFLRILFLQPFTTVCKLTHISNPTANAEFYKSIHVHEPLKD